MALCNRNALCFLNGEKDSLSNKNLHLCLISFLSVDDYYSSLCQSFFESFHVFCRIRLGHLHYDLPGRAMCIRIQPFDFARAPKGVRIQSISHHVPTIERVFLGLSADTKSGRVSVVSAP